VATQGQCTFAASTVRFKALAMSTIIIKSRYSHWELTITVSTRV
jgi:hypothetical protein